MIKNKNTLLTRFVELLPPAMIDNKVQLTGSCWIPMYTDSDNILKDESAELTVYTTDLRTIFSILDKIYAKERLAKIRYCGDNTWVLPLFTRDEHSTITIKEVKKLPFKDKYCNGHSYLPVLNLSAYILTLFKLIQSDAKYMAVRSLLAILSNMDVVPDPVMTKTSDAVVLFESVSNLYDPLIEYIPWTKKSQNPQPVVEFFRELQIMHDSGNYNKTWSHTEMKWI